MGSVEWVEQHTKILTERAVVYLNFDISVGGNFVMGSRSSPLMKDDIWRHTKLVEDPNKHDSQDSIYDIMLERNPPKKGDDPGKPQIPTLGSGSDFASFYQYVGVPAADFSYYFGYNNKPMFYPVYHSQHDTYNWMVKFVDPEFKFHKAMTQLGGSLLLDYADKPLLSMSAPHYATMLEKSLTALKQDENLGSISLDILEKAVEKFRAAATEFESERSVRKLPVFHSSHLLLGCRLACSLCPCLVFLLVYSHVYWLTSLPFCGLLRSSSLAYPLPPPFPTLSLVSCLQTLLLSFDQPHPSPDSCLFT